MNIRIWIRGKAFLVFYKVLNDSLQGFKFYEKSNCLRSNEYMYLNYIYVPMLEYKKDLTTGSYLKGCQSISCKDRGGTASKTFLAQTFTSSCHHSNN